MFYRWNFCQCQKRGDCIGKTKRGKGSKIMVIGDASGLPVSAVVASASPHEITLVEKTVDEMWTANFPKRLIGDKAYDSDKHDALLKNSCGIELIAPNRRNIKAGTKPQDGRPLRRYKRRWMIERINAWLQNFRRVTIRWDYKAINYSGFVHLACLSIIIRNINF